jgi:hypothetical protein
MTKLNISVGKLVNKEEIALKIDGEIKTVSMKGDKNIDIDYGEHEISVYENFLLKSGTERINITEKETEIRIDFNYLLFAIVSVLHFILVGAIAMKLFFSIIFLIMLAVLAVDFFLLVKMGVYKIHIN